VLATTWRLAADGQSVLIYCPERRSVEPYAREIVKLHRQGLLSSLIGDAEVHLSRAIAIGMEWFGADHSILKCLSLGVAVHHGALPTPFRKEIERLLRDGILKVTLSSPTLAQGLNLAATCVVMHGIVRNREVIKPSEFKNVIGRAGRAFVDVEGLVLFPFFESNGLRQAQWEGLKAGDGARELESGLLLLILSFLHRLHRQLGGTLAQLADYVLNNTQAWNCPVFSNETASEADFERVLWQRHLATLDTAILSLIGEQDVAEADVAAKLDEVLASSLWERRLNRRNDEYQRLFKDALLGRATFLWRNSNAVQRRSYFLAGVGLETGQRLDAAAVAANELLVNANGHILNGSGPEAIEAITALAEHLFAISPFIPDPLPVNWRDILAAWLRGESISDIGGGKEDVLRFVENGLIYRLPWGMEAIRVRGLAAGDTIEGGLTLSDYEIGVAVPAVETGTLNRSAALLMQAGFASRLAAIKAVEDTAATFTNYQELKSWLASPAVVALSNTPDWPTDASAEMWHTFLTTFVPPDRAHWKDWTYSVPVNWESIEHRPLAGAAVRIVRSPWDTGSLVLAPDHAFLGTLAHPLNANRKGLLVAVVNADRTRVQMRYAGPADLTPGQLA
jgi:hypothetical protein